MIVTDDRSGSLIPVEVGTTLTGRPPHRSGRAELPHPALAVGHDVPLVATYSSCSTLPTYPGSASGVGRHKMNCRLPVAFPPSPPPPFGLVRRLLRYYATVRLPETVHRRLAALAFPTRPASSIAGVLRTSRFPCKMFPCMYRVSDRAEPAQVSRKAGRPANNLEQCGLPSSLIPSALWCGSCLSRLNTRPALSPVNASPGRLLVRTHDLGSIWFATP